MPDPHAYAAAPTECWQGTPSARAKGGQPVEGGHPAPDAPRNNAGHGETPLPPSAHTTNARTPRIRGQASVPAAQPSHTIPHATSRRPMDEGLAVGGKHRKLEHGGHASKDRGGLAPLLCLQTPQHNNMLEPAALRNTLPGSPALDEAQEVIRAPGLRNRGAPFPLRAQTPTWSWSQHSLRTAPRRSLPGQRVVCRPSAPHGGGVTAPGRAGAPGNSPSTPLTMGHCQRLGALPRAPHCAMAWRKTGSRTRPHAAA